jgi:D-amino-acid dehydrogenase
VTDDTCVSEVVFAAQRAFVARHLPAHAGLPVRARWSGIMAFTADGLPIVGRVPGHERRWVGAACNGHGLAFGPRSARLLAEAILGSDRLPIGFSPARFS